MGERSSTDEPVAVSDGYRGVERRRNLGTSQTPTMDMLAALPALLVLERLPVPVLAVEHDGTIVFANEPFARMVGWPRHGLVSQSFSQIFHGLPTAQSVVSVFRDHAGVVVELAHADGWIVRARMSTSALQRVDDPVALVAFDDLTEQLWSTHSGCSSSFARTALAVCDV